MKIEDLYLELGKAMTEKVHVAQKANDDDKVYQAEINEVSQRMYNAREAHKAKQERIQQHIDELQEAIKLASEGIDPCLAKLTAKESLEERRQAQKIADTITGQTVRINTSLPNTYYGNVAAGNCYAPYVNHPVNLKGSV